MVHTENTLRLKKELKLKSFSSCAQCVLRLHMFFRINSDYLPTWHYQLVLVRETQCAFCEMNFLYYLRTSEASEGSERSTRILLEEEACETDPFVSKISPVKSSPNKRLS